MSTICYNPIGVVRSPFKELAGMPIQTVGAKGVLGSLEIAPDYAAGLQDLDGFSHLILLCHLHLSESFRLQVTPFLDDQPHGVFATRSPKRPNPIGLSVVRLMRVEGPIVHIEDVDIVDGTPVLDLKPYVPVFDGRETERIGWYVKNIDQAYSAKAY